MKRAPGCPRLAFRLTLALMMLWAGCGEDGVGVEVGGKVSHDVAEVGDAGTESADPVVARVDGESVRRSEIERRAGWRLYRAQLDVHLALERETERWIEERLLERAARADGVDVDSLLEEAAADVEPVRDADVTRYLEAHPSEVSIEMARPRIRHYLEQRRAIDRRLALLAGLREAAEVEILLTLPPRPRSELDTRDAPTRGPAAASIEIVHFADLSREDSARSARQLARLERELPGEIRVVHRSLPVERDELGLLTAQLAAAAQRTGSFWALHDRLVAAGGVRRRVELESIARALELGDLLSGLADDDDSLRRVRRELGHARDAGVTRAPTLFVNGRYFMGLDGYEALRALVEEELGVDRRR